MSVSPDIRFSFGMIVLNGEPLTTYNLRQIYPFAYEIIVVEGACPGARANATEDGHSKDGTLESLFRFMEDEDPEHKVRVIRAEECGHPDGFWSEKDEMSQTYANAATGDYLWQIDVDEFYLADTISDIRNMLIEDRSISCVGFQQISFWGGFDYINDGWYMRSKARAVNRVFKWGKGYKYASHRPVTVVDESGRDMRKQNPIDDRATAQMGAFMFHYCLVFPSQIKDKCAYYRSTEQAFIPGIDKWASDSYFSLKDPYHSHDVRDYPSWITRYKKKHPEQIDVLRDNIDQGIQPIECRSNQDVEQLLGSIHYKTGVFFLSSIFPIVRPILPLWRIWALRKDTKMLWKKIKSKIVR